MEIEPCIMKLKNIYHVLMNYIEATVDSNIKFQELIEIFRKEEIAKNKHLVSLT